LFRCNECYWEFTSPAVCCDVEVELYFVAAPSREAQATDALLALAKMQPLSAAGTQPVTEQEIEDLKRQARS